MNAKPQSIEEYARWLREKHDAPIGRAREHYKTVTEKLKSETTSSEFWDELHLLVENAPDEYSLKTGYDLFARPPSSDLKIKPYESFFEKTFRKNVLENEKWPDPPQVGWYLPAGWFEQVNDILRTLYVVKYLDGVEYLLAELRAIAASLNLPFRAHFVAKDEGYYAVHSYTSLSLAVPSLEFESQRRDVDVEIQITTQLQDVIRDLLHEYYEQDRLDQNGPEKPWQWKYRTERFFANHLGHTLNYIEGMIMDLRD